VANVSHELRTPVSVIQPTRRPCWMARSRTPRAARVF
jgi:signal transduction histidine kinase